MFNKLTEQLQKDPKTIVFTEGPDARILEAADKLLKDKILNVILVGEKAEVEEITKEEIKEETVEADEALTMKYIPKQRRKK